MSEAPTVGFIWTSSATGSSIKYAYREESPDGTEQIVLATERRMSRDTPPEEAFTLTEIRLDASGVGEGRASSLLQGATNGADMPITLADYESAPATLNNIRRRSN